MSNSSPRVAATFLTSAARRLTPSDMLPDCTMRARAAAARNLAKWPSSRPVVPTTCTMPVFAAISAKPTLAAGAVKSSTPSAWAKAASGSSVIARFARPAPARRPASSPKAIEPGCSIAPASVHPSVSEMVLTSMRPMRPPAPTTTRPMSAMEALLRVPREWSVGNRQWSIAVHEGRLTTDHSPLAWLRPVVALDHDDVGDRSALALRLGGFVLGRVPAGERRLVGEKLDHDVAAARLALDGLVLAAADEEASAELREGDAVRRDVVLVGVGILDVDMGDPIALRHDFRPPRPRRCRRGRRPRASSSPPGIRESGSSASPARETRTR